VKVKWSEEAKADTFRLHAFLAAVNKRAAALNASALIAASRKLGEYPRIGQRVDRFETREVRRIFVGN
jgi:plasmid stabilization system protein ParE